MEKAETLGAKEEANAAGDEEKPHGTKHATGLNVWELPELHPLQGVTGEDLDTNRNAGDLSASASALARESEEMAAAYPMSYNSSGLENWINTNLPAVRDQNPYGTCWAFATAAPAEIYLKKTQNEDADFSEWHLSHWMYTTAESQAGLSIQRVWVLFQLILCRL